MKPLSLVAAALLAAVADASTIGADHKMRECERATTREIAITSVAAREKEKKQYIRGALHVIAHQRCINFQVLPSMRAVPPAAPFVTGAALRLTVDSTALRRWLCGGISGRVCAIGGGCLRLCLGGHPSMPVECLDRHHAAAIHPLPHAPRDGHELPPPPPRATLLTRHDDTTPPSCN
ncbi:hypothetical protein PCL_02315 [Purpureocillium lilacinum]|uniref:Uncharacterized protein n=1 Tax=Purpureocillium lilacinum TaxID=33203 RepID=A0A2U3E099_PURLI|nr:hypothetical protein PCL_02315 [Purpureocillium lilacinum]